MLTLREPTGLPNCAEIWLARRIDEDPRRRCRMAISPTALGGPLAEELGLREAVC